MNQLPETIPTSLVLWAGGAYFVLVKLVVVWLLRDRATLIAKLETKSTEFNKFLLDLWRDGQDGGH